jgi:biotin-(acetyl-CoA carboxylase) ligase
LIRDSNDYNPGDLILEATVVPVATPVVKAAPLAAKLGAGAAKSAAPAAELSEKEKAANVKKEEAKIKLLSTIEALTQQLEAKKSAISEDEYAELSATLVSTKKMINEGNAMAQVAIRGLKSSIE